MIFFFIVVNSFFNPDGEMHFRCALLTETLCYGTAAECGIEDGDLINVSLMMRGGMFFPISSRYGYDSLKRMDACILRVAVPPSWSDPSLPSEFTVK